MVWSTCRCRTRWLLSRFPPLAHYCTARSRAALTSHRTPWDSSSAWPNLNSLSANASGNQTERFRQVRRRLFSETVDHPGSTKAGASPSSSQVSMVHNQTAAAVLGEHRTPHRAVDTDQRGQRLSAAVIVDRPALLQPARQRGDRLPEAG